jgi:hypothetical protein
MGIHKTHEQRKSEIEKADEEQRKAIYEEIIEREKKYEPLFSNPLFQEFLKEEVKTQIEIWEINGNNINLSKDNALVQVGEIRGKKLMAKYIHDLPQTIKEDARISRKEIVKIEKGDGNG